MSNLNHINTLPFHSSLALFSTSVVGVFTSSLNSSESLPEIVKKQEMGEDEADWAKERVGDDCKEDKKHLPFTVRILHSPNLPVMSSVSLAFILSTSVANSSGDNLTSQLLESPTLY